MAYEDFSVEFYLGYVENGVTNIDVTKQVTSFIYSWGNTLDVDEGRDIGYLQPYGEMIVEDIQGRFNPDGNN